MKKINQREYYNKKYKEGGYNKMYHKSYKESQYYPIWDYTIKYISKKFERNKWLLIQELGCGTGQFAEMLMTKYSEGYLLPGEIEYDKSFNSYKYWGYRGYDISDIAIKMATERIIMNRTNRTINKNINYYFFRFDFFERSFKILIDLIKKDKYPNNIFICFEVLEHLQNNKDLKLIELLPKNTEFIFSVPDFIDKDKTHCCCFKTKKEITNRYRKLLKFTEIKRIKNWFLCFCIIK